MMSQWERLKDFDVSRAQSELHQLIGCCMDTAQFQPEDIVLVRDAYDQGHGEREGFRIYDLKNGKIGVVQDGEDYSGHG